MSLNWGGAELKNRVRAAQIEAVDATMAAAIIKAKANHGPGAHASGRFEADTGSLQRSIQIKQQGTPVPGGIKGIWGSLDVIYAQRIELGFQGKDKLGRVINAPAFPYLRPAADEEYPKLAKRIKRVLQ